MWRWKKEWNSTPAFGIYFKRPMKIQKVVCALSGREVLERKKEKKRGQSRHFTGRIGWFISNIIVDRKRFADVENLLWRCDETEFDTGNQ